MMNEKRDRDSDLEEVILKVVALINSDLHRQRPRLRGQRRDLEGVIQKVARSKTTTLRR